MDKEKETAVEHVRNVKDMIDTEETALEEKAKDLPTVGVKLVHTLQYISIEGRDLTESERNVNIYVMDISVR